MKKWVYTLLASLMVIVPPLGFTIGSIIAYDVDEAYDHIIVAENQHDENKQIVITPYEVSDKLTFDEISRADSVLGGESVVLFVREPIFITSDFRMTMDKDLEAKEIYVKKGNYIKVYGGDIQYSSDVLFIQKASIKASSPYISLGFGTLIVSILGGVIVAQIVLKKMDWYKQHPRTATFLALASGTLILYLVNAIVGNLLGVFTFALIGWAGYCGLYTYDTKLYPLIVKKKQEKQDVLLEKQKQEETAKREKEQGELGIKAESKGE